MRLIDADSTYLQDAIGRNAFKTRDDIRALIDRAPTVDLNAKTEQNGAERSFVDPCKDGKRHDWKKWAVSIDAELNTVTTYRCLKCGETFNIKFEKV